MKEKLGRLGIVVWLTALSVLMAIFGTIVLGLNANNKVINANFLEIQQWMNSQKAGDSPSVVVYCDPNKPVVLIRNLPAMENLWLVATQESSGISVPYDFLDVVNANSISVIDGAASDLHQNDSFQLTPGRYVLSGYGEPYSKTPNFGVENLVFQISFDVRNCEPGFVY